MLVLLVPISRRAKRVLIVAKGLVVIVALVSPVHVIILITSGVEVLLPVANSVRSDNTAAPIAAADGAAVAVNLTFASLVKTIRVPGPLRARSVVGIHLLTILPL